MKKNVKPKISEENALKILPLLNSVGHLVTVMALSGCNFNVCVEAMNLMNNEGDILDAMEALENKEAYLAGMNHLKSEILIMSILEDYDGPEIEEIHEAVILSLENLKKVNSPD